MARKLRFNHIAPKNSSIIPANTNNKKGSQVNILPDGSKCCKFSNVATLLPRVIPVDLLTILMLILLFRLFMNTFAIDRWHCFLIRLGVR